MHRLGLSKQNAMKVLNTFLILSAILIVASCTKYEDGPTVSLKTEQARLARTWKVQLAYYSEFTDSPENGDNQTTDWSNLRVDFDKNSAYTISNKSADLSKITTETGAWEFTDDKLKLKTTGVERITEAGTNTLISETTKTTTWRILKLKRNEFWCWYQNADTPPWMYFRMIPT